MTVILVLFTFIAFLLLDHLKTAYDRKRSTVRPQMYVRPVYTTPGFEMLGALAQDGGEIYKKELAKIVAEEAKKPKAKTVAQPTASC